MCLRSGVVALSSHFTIHHHGSFTQRTAAFINQLVAVNEAPKRIALISRLLLEVHPVRLGLTPPPPQGLLRGLGGGCAKAEAAELCSQGAARLCAAGEVHEHSACHAAADGGEDTVTGWLHRASSFDRGHQVNAFRPQKVEGIDKRPDKLGPVERLRTIQAEAMNVLDRMQRGELTAVGP